MDFIMLKLIRRLSTQKALFECFYCKSIYETNYYGAKRGPLGHICKNCKSINPNNLTQEKLKQLIHYDPDTGTITANMPRHGINSGDELGYVANTGYRVVCLGSKRFLAHRLAWFYMNGYFPEQIDHINHIRTDNRWVNLREVSDATNKLNTGLSKNSKTKFNGVSFIRTLNKYRAYIMIDRKHIHLGVYKTLEEAIQARQEANVKYGFHSNHGK